MVTESFNKIGGKANLEPPRILFGLKLKEVEDASLRKDISVANVIVCLCPFIRACNLRSQLLADALAIVYSDVSHELATTAGSGQPLCLNFEPFDLLKDRLLPSAQLGS